MREFADAKTLEARMAVVEAVIDCMHVRQGQRDEMAGRCTVIASMK